MRTNMHIQKDFRPLTLIDSTYCVFQEQYLTDGELGGFRAAEEILEEIQLRYPEAGHVAVMRLWIRIAWSKSVKMLN